MKSDTQIVETVEQAFKDLQDKNYHDVIESLEKLRLEIDSHSEKSEAAKIHYCGLLKYLSAAYFYLGEYDKALEPALIAIDQYEELISGGYDDTDGNFPDQCDLTACILSLCGKFEESIPFFDKAISLGQDPVLHIMNKTSACISHEAHIAARESLENIFKKGTRFSTLGEKNPEQLQQRLSRLIDLSTSVKDSEFLLYFLNRLSNDIDAQAKIIRPDLRIDCYLQFADALFSFSLFEDAARTTLNGVAYLENLELTEDEAARYSRLLKLDNALYLGAAGDSVAAISQIDDYLSTLNPKVSEEVEDESVQIACAIRSLEIGKIEMNHKNNEEAADALMEAWRTFPQRKRNVKITYAQAVCRIHLGELLLDSRQNQEAKTSFAISNMLLSRLARDNQINFDFELIRSAIGLGRCEIRQLNHSKAEKHFHNATEIAAHHALDPRFQKLREQLTIHQRALKAQKCSENTKDAASSEHPLGESTVSRVHKPIIDTSKLSRSIEFENFAISQKWINYGIIFFTMTSVLFALILPNLLYKLGVFVISLLFWTTFSTCYFLYSTNPWTRISKLSFNLNEVVTLRPTPFLNTRVERTGQQNELEEALKNMASWYSPFVVGLAMLFFGWMLGNLLVFFPGPGFETPYSAAFFFAIQAWGPLGFLIVRLRVFSKHSNGKLVLRPRYNFVVRRICGLIGRFDEDAAGLTNLHATGIDVLFTRPCAKPGLGQKYSRFRFPWLTIAWFCLSTALMILSYPILLITVMVWIAWPEIQANM